MDRYAIEEISDGVVERKQKGTISLLDEWLFSGSVNWGNIAEARQEIMEPLKVIRRERQSPAHKIIQNEFDQLYTVRRRELLRDAAFALGNIMFILRKHPQAPVIRVPKWLEKARIEVL